LPIKWRAPQPADDYLTAAERFAAVAVQVLGRLAGAYASCSASPMLAPDTAWQSETSANTALT